MILEKGNSDSKKFMLDAFPKRFENDIEVIVNFLDTKLSTYFDKTTRIKIGSETINLPQRIYYYEITDENLENMTERQRRIVYCYFMCHNDGYIRQKYLRKIICTGIVYEFEMPYIVALLGQYIIEISKDIYDDFELLIKNNLEKFICENPLYIRTIESQIATYWGVYYRKYPKESYFGFEIQKKLEKMRNSCLK